MGLFDDKTEAATPKKREDARKKGQVARSREIVSVAVLVAGFLALRKALPQFWAVAAEDTRHYLSAAVIGDRAGAISAAPVHVAAALATVLLPLLVAVFVASLVANVGQTGPMLISQGLKWDFTRLNPAAGLKRMVSAQPVMELLKATAKVGFVGWVVYSWLAANYPSICEMTAMDLREACAFAGQRIDALFWRTVSALMVIALADYAWQRYQHEMQLRMSRQELKDEYRQTEGAPEIRQAIRRRMREMKRRAMLSALRSADVVITNPTHYAVALRYDSKTMEAPEVVAAGQRRLALKIRELAEAYGVPIVENPPLARALFAACDVGDTVPPELYAAVAQVLAFVYRMTGRLPTSRREA